MLRVVPFFSSEKCRIFLVFGVFPYGVIEEILKLPKKLNDYFILNDSFYPENIERYLDGLKKYNLENNVIFTSNTREIHEARLNAGYKSYFVNHNCFINETLFKVMPEKKIFDAVYIGRFTYRADKPQWNNELKRHFLTSKIENLALLESCANLNNVVSNIDLAMTQKYCKAKNCKYCNDKKLPQEQVVKILNQSKVGLILSELEGTCRASSEYLLCGLPVVSTESKGGRDIWYTKQNSIICESTQDSVKEAVDYFVSNPPNSKKVREECIKQIAEHRARFANETLNDLFRLAGENADPEKVLLENLSATHEWIGSNKKSYDFNSKRMTKYSNGLFAKMSRFFGKG